MRETTSYTCGIVLCFVSESTVLVVYICSQVYRPASGKYDRLEKRYLRSLDEEQILWKGTELIEWCCHGDRRAPLSHPLLSPTPMKSFLARTGQKAIWKIFLAGLGDFFNCTYSQLYKHVIRAFLEKLQTIRQWFEEQRQLNFYSSSLLLVYDACDIDPSLKGASASDTSTLETDEALHLHGSGGQPHVAVNMIDFAHVFPSKERDSNYLKGVDGLISYLEKLLWW